MITWQVCDVHGTDMTAMKGDFWFGRASELMGEPDSWKCWSCEEDQLAKIVESAKHIGDIGDLCYQSRPCKHHVMLDNKCQFLDGTQIANLQHRLNGSIDEHFRKYKSEN